MAMHVNAYMILALSLSERKGKCVRWSVKLTHSVCPWPPARRLSGGCQVSTCPAVRQEATCHRHQLALNSSKAIRGMHSAFSTLTGISRGDYFLELLWRFLGHSWYNWPILRLCSFLTIALHCLRCANHIRLQWWQSNLEEQAHFYGT